MKTSFENGVFELRRQAETLRIEPWGKNAFRVRGTKYPEFTGRDWALTEPVTPAAEAGVTAEQHEDGGWTITNGRISVWVNRVGILTFYRDGEKILREHYRSYDGTISRQSRCLKVVARNYIPRTGGDYQLNIKFEANDGEKLFGMGQYQQAQTNMKGCFLDLAQRNSQVTIPFALSNLGYGFLWNNPAVGRATFGYNITEWTSECSKEMDYWICADEDPRAIVEDYCAVTGRAPEFPEDLMGLWQCKLRYRTQEEVLDVAHACKEHNVPIDLIVIDFFHWPYQGDWRFDETYWPDPKAMVDELHSMGIKVCVSVWPSVDRRSENFGEMFENGMLIRTERGSIQTYDYLGDCLEIDATNPETRDYVWAKLKKNYADYGIDMFWMDNAEPDYAVYDYDNYRYWMGTALECTNIYPQYYSRIVYDNQVKEGLPAVNLLRSAWAGSQKYGNVVWSGDVPSTFEGFRDQFQCGINMAICGMPWWTTDIGGFMTDDVADPYFQQLLIRWYEFAVYTPILRMHGDRGPYNIPNLDNSSFGGGSQRTGQPNELWSYGEKNFKIMRDYLDVRLAMKPYIKQLFDEAHETGAPLLRPMFYEFPTDEKCWDLYDQYLFGDKLLVAPIFCEDMWEREVYLPAGTWKDVRTGEVFEGGQTIVSPAPLESIPVFERQ